VIKGGIRPTAEGRSLSPWLVPNFLKNFGLGPCTGRYATKSGRPGPTLGYTAFCRALGLVGPTILFGKKNVRAGSGLKSFQTIGLGWGRARTVRAEVGPGRRKYTIASSLPILLSKAKVTGLTSLRKDSTTLIIEYLHLPVAFERLIQESWVCGYQNYTWGRDKPSFCVRRRVPKLE
jgi:hypothetical protein